MQEPVVDDSGSGVVRNRTGNNFGGRITADKQSSLAVIGDGTVSECGIAGGEFQAAIRVPIDHGVINEKAAFSGWCFGLEQTTARVVCDGAVNKGCDTGVGQSTTSHDRVVEVDCGVTSDSGRGSRESVRSDR